MLKGKKIHLIGIGGISMSSIALLLLNEESIVTGSDITESDLTRELESKGIKVMYGHHPEMIDEADIVVYTAAIKEDDLELVRARELNKECYERSQFLGKISLSYSNRLCISGTHGKSTTTGMLSLIFLEAGLNPTIQVGAVFKEINGNTFIGSKDYFVMEACEYTDSFLDFYPTGAIVTNIDNDHLDYFKNLDNIKASFNKFVNLLPENGYLVKNNDDVNSLNVEKGTSAKVISYAINNEADYTAKNITINDLGHYSYDLYKNNEFVTKIELSINGKHNIYNSLAAFALANQYILDSSVIAKAINKYSGVNRRFEYLGKVNGAYVIDDYAHHPSEIKTTLESVNETKHNKCYAIFESHTYSRTKEHLDAFADVLSKFENVIIAPIYAAREINTFNVSEEMLVNKIKEKNPNAIYLDSFDKIIDYIKANAKENDLVITIGAGNVTKIAHKLIES